MTMYRRATTTLLDEYVRQEKGANETILAWPVSNIASALQNKCSHLANALRNQSQMHTVGPEYQVLKQFD